MKGRTASSLLIDIGWQQRTERTYFHTGKYPFSITLKLISPFLNYHLILCYA
jgi:hypothetical protein